MTGLSFDVLPGQIQIHLAGTSGEISFRQGRSSLMTFKLIGKGAAKLPRQIALEHFDCARDRLFRPQAHQESQVIVSYLGLQQMVLLARADAGKHISYQSVFVRSREQRLQIMGLEG